jgi:hypothetical protein
MQKVASLFGHAKNNLGFIVTSTLVGAAIGSLTSAKPPCSRFPPAISTNLQLVTALSALEEVLPNPLLMTKLVLHCERLCTLEFNAYSGAQYLAVVVLNDIQHELHSFRVIPWLSEDLFELEEAVMQAVMNVQNNIGVEFATR